jgi:hypothetical protein
MLKHPPEVGTPATRTCPECGTLVGVVDDRDGRQRRYARDAEGRVGEIMPSAIPERLLAPGARRIVNLRPVDGGVEWATDADNLTPCDRDGRELPPGEPS